MGFGQVLFLWVLFRFCLIGFVSCFVSLGLGSGFVSIGFCFMFCFFGSWFRFCLYRFWFGFDFPGWFGLDNSVISWFSSYTHILVLQVFP